jgi:pyruvate/oxaloacetate carboxyltransferase
LTIRRELAEFDSVKELPRPWVYGQDPLPKEVENLFDAAIEAGRRDDFAAVTDLTQKIEAFFHFPAPDEVVCKAQIPGGMYSNMIAQLSALKLDHLFNRALELVPQVRLNAGCPPLVTPTSQIVGVQAVNCVIDENKQNPHYTNASVQFVNLVKGSYGKTPIAVDPKFRQKLTGSPIEVPYDTSKHQPQNNPALSKYDGARLARNEREVLLLELFPNVAQPFLTKQREAEFAIKEKERIRQNALPDQWDGLADWA